MNEQQKQNRKPGICVPWEEKAKELSKIAGDEKLLQRIWEENETLAYLYIWHILVSF